MPPNCSNHRPATWKYDRCHSEVRMAHTEDQRLALQLARRIASLALLVLASSSVCGGSRFSADYTVPADTLGSGGGGSASTAYVNAASIGGLGTGSSSWSNYPVLPGYMGQVSAAGAMPSTNVVILQQPIGQVVAARGSLILVVGASGTEPMSYQWLRNGANLLDNDRVAGSQSPSLTIASALASDSGGYRVVVRNPYSSATSAVATVAVTCPTITLSPALLPDATANVPYSQTDRKSVV